MPRGLGRFGYLLKQSPLEDHKDVTIDIYSLMSFPAAALLLAYYMTFQPLNPGVAQIGTIGAVLGVIGWAGGIGISYIGPRVFGRLKFSFQLLNPQGYQSTAITVMIFAIMSILMQSAVLAIRPQAGLTIPSTPIDAFLFVQAMAIMETWFFVFFVFRIFRAGGGWILADIATSLIFGFAYHQVVYNADPFYMGAAVMGSIIYCASLQVTGRLSVSMVLHQIQNFIATIGMVLAQLQAALSA